MKVAIVGVGNIGVSIAQSLAAKNIFDEIALIDKNNKKAKEKAQYITYVSPLLGRTKVYGSGIEATADADIIVLAASLSENISEAVKEAAEITQKITAFNRSAIILVVSLPMDIITYTVTKVSGFPKEKVFGIGTFIDSIRIESILAKELNHNPKDLEVMVIGEHGENLVPIFSCASIHGIPLNKITNIAENTLSELLAKVKKESKELILSCKDSIGPSVAAVSIIESIVFNSKKVIPVSFYQTGAYNITDVALSLPAVIGKNGIEDILTIELTNEESSELIVSMEMLKSEIREIEAL